MTFSGPRPMVILASERTSGLLFPRRGCSFQVGITVMVEDSVTAGYTGWEMIG